MVWNRFIVFAGLLTAACAMSVVPEPIAPVVPAQLVRTVPQTQSEITLSFSPVVKQTAPAVVNIYTKKVVQRRTSPFAGDPFFENFFQDMFPAQRTRRKIENSLGSGVILDSSGIVVSNHHVVGGADEITVVLQDRREYDAELIFEDAESDLAVLRLAGASALPTLQVRDSDTLEVGDLVLAIGNPFGVGQTVTSGIISGLTRSGGARGNGPGVFIQTDAAINPGNSGGALVDMQGRLVGVNTAILSRSGGSNGIGFAIPSNLVARVVNSARAGQTTLVRPWLGLDGQEVTGDLASALQLPTPQGILVSDLHADSPLLSAGMRRGDVITAMGGAPVNTVQELEFRATTVPLGGQISIRYLRDGQSFESAVALNAAPDIPPRDQRNLGRADGLPGVIIANVNPRLIDELDLPVSSKGVLVLAARGPAGRVGLRPGDFIRQVNRTEISDVAALVPVLRKTSGPTEIRIERNGRTRIISYRR